MTSALAHYLTDFGTGEPPRAFARPAADLRRPSSPVEALPPVDLDAVRDEAREEGRRAAEAELRAEFETERHALSSRHEDEMARMKERYEAELAERIAQRFEAMRTELGGRIGRQAAEVLAPFVENAAREAMVRAFGAAIVEALGDPAQTVVTVRGPAYLFGYLEGLPAFGALRLEHVATEDVDLSTEIDGTALATRIADLAASLLEGGR